MRITASQVGRWIFCPRAFYFEKVMNLPVIHNKKMFIGSTLHKIHEHFFVKKLYENEEGFKRYIENDLLNFVSDTDKLTLLNVDREEFLLALKRACELLQKKYKEGRIYKPIHIEKQFSTPFLSAYPDVVYEINGEIVICDIKPEDNINMSIKLQITTGAILVEEKERRPVKKGLMLSWMDWGYTETDITEDDKTLLNEVLENIRNTLKNSSLPKLKYEPHKCKSCSYNHICNLEGEDRSVYLKEVFSEKEFDLSKIGVEKRRASLSFEIDELFKAPAK